MKKNLLITLLFVVGLLSLQGQESTIKKIVKEINLQKTANSKDIFTSLFRASADNLLGDEHSFTFNSSFYGIDSIFRSKGTSISYERERSLRQKSFNIALAADSLNNITKVTGGFTFTLINKKDITYTKFREEDASKLKAMSFLMINLKREINNFIASNHPAEFGTDSINRAITTSWTEADKKNDYTNLHPFIIEALQSNEVAKAVNSQAKTAHSLDTIYSVHEVSEIMDGISKGGDRFHELFVAIGEKYARRPILTFTPTLSYDRTNKQAEYSFASDFSVGLGKDLTKKPWELEIKSLFRIANDTTLNNVNYQNKPFQMSLGVNKVVIENDDNESKMEFKFFTQYEYQFGNVPEGKKAGVFTLNSTFRVNVFKSLWIPVTLKYDPENSNFFGYFSLTANLGD
jgi:hypothetical protein